MVIVFSSMCPNGGQTLPRSVSWPCPPSPVTAFASRSCSGLNSNAQQRDIDQRAGDRQHGHGSMLIEGIGRDHQRRTRLAVISLDGDGHEVASSFLPAIQVRQSLIHEMPRVRIRSGGLCCQQTLAAATLGKLRPTGILHSELNRRRPARRRAARRFLTRSLTGLVAMATSLMCYMLHNRFYALSHAMACLAMSKIR